MMSGDNFTNGSRKTRTVLGDVTNRPGKRGLSLVSGDLGPKSGDGYVKISGGENGSSDFGKRVCLRVENLIKETCNTECGADVKETGVCMLKDKQTCGSLPTSQCDNVVSVVANAPDKMEKAPDLGVTIAHTGEELGDTLRESCVSSVSIPICSKEDCDGGRGLVSEATQNNVVREGILASRVCSDKEFGGGRLASSKCGSIEWSRLPTSQGSKPFELERCVGLQGDGCMNLNAGASLLKDCSCSFCLKAAYIWSDLHYQDIKGRIAALKKSQKEANFLVQKCSRGKQTDIPDQENSSKSSKLESDLMSQWRSLFLHMEDIFVRESTQLQAGFLMLKDLRENCKMDLEKSTGMPPDQH